MSYDHRTTRIFYKTETNGVAIGIPTGELPVEVVAVRDLPKGTPYWIIDFKNENDVINSVPHPIFYDAYELDESVLGSPHGIALGYEEWAKQQPPGTPGL